MSSFDQDLATQGGAVIAPPVKPMSSFDADLATHTISHSQMDPALAAEATLGPSTLQIGPWDTGITMGQAGYRRAAGIGSAMTNLVQGAKEAVGMATPQDVHAKRELDAPLMQTPEGKTGAFVGNAAMALPLSFVPGANTVTGAGAVGALYGDVQPYETQQERALNILGGAGGSMLGQGLGVLAGNIARSADMPSTPLTQGQQQALQDAQQLGMQLPPGKMSGSRPQQLLEAAMESQPETSGPFNAMKQQSQKVLNSVAAKSIGVNADELSNPVLQQAKDQIGAVYDKVATKTVAPIDPDAAMNQLAAIEKNYEGQYAGNNNISTHPLVQKYLNFAADGGATGEQLQSLSSNLNKAAKNNMTSAGGDRALGQALFDVKDAVDDSLQSSLSPQMQAEFANARGNYRNLMNLTTRNNVVNPSSGNVNGQALANALMSRDRGGFTFGNNDSDLYKAARVIQAFPDIVGNSGTATRAAGGLTLPGIAAHAAGAVASRAYMTPVAQAILQNSTYPATMLAKGLLAAPQGALPAAGTAAGLGLANALR